MFNTSAKFQDFISREFNILTNFALTKKAVNGINHRLLSFRTYSKKDCILMTVQLYEGIIIYSLLVSTLIITSYYSFETILLSAFIPFIVYQNRVDKKFDNMYIAILRELSHTIESLIQYYQKSSNLNKALLECKSSNIVKANIEAIYAVINSNDIEEALEEFLKDCEITYIKTLAIICYKTEEYGDSFDEKGLNYFIKELTVLQQEVNTEVLRGMKTQDAFKSVSAIIPIAFVFMYFVENMMGKQIPGIAVILQSTYGTLVRSLILVSAIVSYSIINKLKRILISVESDTLNFMFRVYEKFHKIVDLIKTKSESKVNYWNDMLYKAMSSKTINYIYTAKILYTVLTFFILNLVITVSLFTYRSYIYNYDGNFGLESDIQPLPKAQAVKLKAFEQEYLKKNGKAEDVFLDDTLFKIGGELKNDIVRKSHLDRIKIKKDKYISSTYKWQYLLLVYIICSIVWFTQEIQLLFRRYILRLSEFEEILFIQNIIIILHTTTISLTQLMYWLYSSTILFRPALMYCYLEFPQKGVDAFERLEDSTNNRDFKSICSKLQSSVFDLSLKESFNNIYIIKEQSLKVREILMEQSIKKKKTFAVISAYVTLVLVVVFVLFVPMGSLLMNTLDEVNQIMQATQ